MHIGAAATVAAATIAVAATAIALTTTAAAVAAAAVAAATITLAAAPLAVAAPSFASTGISPRVARRDACGTACAGRFAIAHTHFARRAHERTHSADKGQQRGSRHAASADFLSEVETIATETILKLRAWHTKSDSVCRRGEGATERAREQKQQHRMA